MSFLAYSLMDGILIDEDGEVCEITDMIDAWGDETDAPDAAVVFVAQLPNGEWITVEADGVEAWVH